MPIKVRCPKCSDAFQTSSKNRGRKVACPLCSASIRVSKRSKKASKRSKQEAAAEGENLSDDAIFAVLADGDSFQREYVPRSIDDESGDFEAYDAGDSSVADSSVVDSDASGSSLDLGGLPGMADGVAVESSDARPTSPAASAAADTPANGPAWKRALAPFVAGIVVGAIGAVAGMSLLGSGSATPVAARPSPTPRAPVAPRTPLPASEKKPTASDSTPAPEPAAPPENSEELTALLAKVSVLSAQFEQGGGLLGGGRKLVFRVRNESGLVLDGVTVAAKLSFAAFDDAVLAEERVPITFVPVLGINAEQEVRLAAPSGGAIAGAKIEGPVRLTAKVVDLDWDGKNAE